MKKSTHASSDDEVLEPEDHDPLEEECPPDQELEPEDREPELELCEPL